MIVYSLSNEVLVCIFSFFSNGGDSMVKRTKEELFRDLFRKIESLGRKPTFQEVRCDPDMADPNEYAYYYRSFSDAVDQAWQIYYSSKTTEEETHIDGRYTIQPKAKKPVVAAMDFPKKIALKSKWQPSPERIEEIRQFYLNYFIENDTMPTFIEAEKAVKMTRRELSFMRSKFLLEKTYFVKEAARITGKEYMDPWLEHNQNSIIANRVRREMNKQSENTPIE